MKHADVIVIGAGQAGLVMSRELTIRGVDHVVLERGRIGERWRSERWNSLRLLTTNAMSALPGLSHHGCDPDAFMAATEFASYLTIYAATVAAPVLSRVEVTGVKRNGASYRVSTSAGEWRARAIVIATGACHTPYRPVMAQQLAPSIVQINPSDYREPAQLPDGRVLVVGASATGVQLAEEIHASGRPVTLAVGEHTRVPRRYRGQDIHAQMVAAGILDDPALETGNLEAARRQPSLQLVGRPDRRNLDLGVLQSQGIRLAGRMTAMDGASAAFGNDLARATAASHARMIRILDRIDNHIGSQGIKAAASDAGVRIPIQAGSNATTIDLEREGFRSVVWATGYVRRYPWLHVPVLDSQGEIIHRGGVTPSPGLYVLGLPFQRRRRSNFIDGCGLDAADIAPVVKIHLNRVAKQAA